MGLAGSASTMDRQPLVGSAVTDRTLCPAPMLELVAVASLSGWVLREGRVQRECLGPSVERVAREALVWPQAVLRSVAPLP